MFLLENLYNVWKILSRNKVRSFLTMLGIIIGIMSVIVIMSVGAGAQSLILNQVKGMGSNLIAVLPGSSNEDGPPASAIGIIVTSFKNKDIDAVMNAGNPHVLASSGYIRGRDTVTWGEQKTDTNFVGVNYSYTNVEDAELSTGRFFTEEEDRSSARTAVLGSQVAEDLFQDIDPVGKSIKIKRTSFNIIGVMKKRGVSGFENQDNQIFVPLETAQKTLLGVDYISFARFKIDSADNVEDSMEFVRAILRDQHDITNPDNDDFSVRSMAQGLSTLTTITNALKLFLVAVASIALMVGGIGIMNIMLAAVQERTREIGLRKAVGAKKRQIISQFLIETTAITLTGGLIGIVLGGLISYAVAKIAQGMEYDWEFVISLSSILLACFVSMSIGLLFGLLPARRAANLDPIEALRYE